MITFVTYCLLFQRYQKVLFCSALLEFQWVYSIIVIGSGYYECA